MTYLELVQWGMLLARNGTDRLSEMPTTFAGATGPWYEMIQWIKRADLDIQLSRNGWLFMRGSADLLLPAGASTLEPTVSQNTIRAMLPAEDCGGRRTIGCYADSLADESAVAFITYEQWYGNRIGRGTQQTSGRPGRWSERSGKVYFDAVADRDYRITFDYIRQPQAMELVGSVSILPAERHMAIVYWALFHFYALTRDNTTEIRAKLKPELDRELNRLYADHLPPITVG